MVDSIDIGENNPKQLIVESGTWTLQDSIITYTFLYHSNPARIGTSIRIKHIASGNNVDGYFLGKNDEVNSKVTAIKLD